MTRQLIPVVISFIVIICAISGYIYLQGLWPWHGECRSQLALDFPEDNLKQHVWALAEHIGERHYQQAGSLEKAAAYIHSVFTAYGLATEYQQYGDGYMNLLVTVPGKNPGKPGAREVIVVGAHYDSVWLSSGADDNASGVAVLLELARILSRIPLQKTVQFVAFTNEEHPFADTGQMGSYVYLKQARMDGVKIIAMYSLEMLGFYSDKPGSQQYPFPLNLVYPQTGNFVAMVSNLPSTHLLLQSLSAFRQHSSFPAQGLAMSESLIADIRRSDHAQFWDAGIPSLMLTDTSFYRNERYHTVGDLARTLDYKKMAQLTPALACMLADMAGYSLSD